MTLEQQLNQPHVTIWGANASFGVLGPVFFDRTITGDANLQILTDNIILKLQQQPHFPHLYFQQDGVPPHFTRMVHDCLDENFPEMDRSQRHSQDATTVTELYPQWSVSSGVYKRTK
jgi:hypothetical protein